MPLYHRHAQNNRPHLEERGRHQRGGMGRRLKMGFPWLRSLSRARDNFRTPHHTCSINRHSTVVRKKDTSRQRTLLANERKSAIERESQSVRAIQPRALPLTDRLDKPIKPNDFLMRSFHFALLMSFASRVQRRRGSRHLRSYDNTSRGLHDLVLICYSCTDTPPDKSGGFLVRPGDLLRVEARQQRSGPLSPSVSRSLPNVGSRMPCGTVQGE